MPVIIECDVYSLVSRGRLQRALAKCAVNNTPPMITGFGQFGQIETGGMFTLVKGRAPVGAAYRPWPGGTAAWLMTTTGYVEEVAEKTPPRPGTGALHDPVRDRCGLF